MVPSEQIVVVVGIHVVDLCVVVMVVLSAMIIWGSSFFKSSSRRIGMIMSVQFT